MRLAATAGHPLMASTDGSFGQPVEEATMSAPGSEVEVPDEDHRPHGPGTNTLPTRSGGPPPTKPARSRRRTP